MDREVSQILAKLSMNFKGSYANIGLISMLKSLFWCAEAMKSITDLVKFFTSGMQEHIHCYFEMFHYMREARVLKWFYILSNL